MLDMGSINAQRVAQKISAEVRKGKKVLMSEVIRSFGYAESVARHPDRITSTKAFQKAWNMEIKDILAGIDREIADVQGAMARKNLNKEEYKTLVTAFDTLIKNKQLLSGGSTANVAMKIEISEHVAGKYATPPQGETDVNSKNGSTEPLT